MNKILTTSIDKLDYVKQLEGLLPKHEIRR